MSKRHTRDDIDQLHDYSIYLPTRTLYMGSEDNDAEFGESGVDGAMAERVIKNLHILDTMSQEPITILMNNIGGDINHGLAIYDAILTCRSHVTIKVFGHAMSMGSIILQAADERVMSPNSSQMIHYGSVGIDKEAKAAYKTADEYRRIDKWMEGMFLSRIHERNPNVSLGKLRSLLAHDTFLTAEASVQIGLADKVMGFDDE